jgi:hypothetical protein
MMDLNYSSHEDFLGYTIRFFNERLQYFAIERFICRLFQTPHADQFILKGALMVSAWCGPASRPLSLTDQSS